MLAAIRDTRLFFDVEGAGFVPDGPVMRQHRPALVIHGGPGGDHSGFKPAMTPLAAALQLIYFDHRGNGRSALADPHADPKRFTLHDNVEDMEALRRHLGLGPVVSVGTSYGGMVAMAHAARYPDAVSHLILIVTAAHGGFVPRAEAFVHSHGTPDQQAACDTLWAGAFRSVDELQHYYTVMGPLYARRFDPAGAADGRARALPTTEPINRAFGPGGFLRNFDLRPELPRITAPTLILAGRHDWICPPDFSEEVHRLISGSTLRIFEQSSHSIRTDEPEALNAAILGFID